MEKAVDCPGRNGNGAGIKGCGRKAGNYTGNDRRTESPCAGY